MSDDKQLTVAELLARAGKEGSDKGSEKPRRRRRRSLEDGGGISVAELTGSVPKVDAKPKESKHGEPIDSDSKEAGPEVSDAEGRSEKPEATKAAPAKDASKAPATSVPADETSGSSPAKSGPRSGAHSDSTSATDTEPAAEDTAVISRVSDDDINGPASSTAAGAPGAAKSKTSDSPSQAETPKQSSSALGTKPSAEDEETGEIPKVSDEPSTKRTTGTASGAAAGAAGAATVGGQTAGQAAAAPDVADEHRKPVAATDSKPKSGTDSDDEDQEEGLNPVAVAVLALVGIILGVVVFKGFEMLWDSFNRFLVAALAIGVTGVMAGIIHALRTERDGLSMALAVVVGLLLTFGPLVLVVL